MSDFFIMPDYNSYIIGYVVVKQGEAPKFFPADRQCEFVGDASLKNNKYNYIFTLYKGADQQNTTGLVAFNIYNSFSSSKKYPLSSPVNQYKYNQRWVIDDKSSDMNYAGSAPLENITIYMNNDNMVAGSHTFTADRIQELYNQQRQVQQSPILSGYNCGTNVSSPMYSVTWDNNANPASSVYTGVGDSFSLQQPSSYDDEYNTSPYNAGSNYSTALYSQPQQPQNSFNSYNNQQQQFTVPPLNNYGTNASSTSFGSNYSGFSPYLLQPQGNEGNTDMSQSSGASQGSKNVINVAISALWNRIPRPAKIAIAGIAVAGAILGAVALAITGTVLLYKLLSSRNMKAPLIPNKNDVKILNPGAKLGHVANLAKSLSLGGPAL